MCARNAKRLCRKWGGRKGRDLVMVESFVHPPTQLGKNLLCPSTQQAVLHGLVICLAYVIMGVADCDDTEGGRRNRIFCVSMAETTLLFHLSFFYNLMLKK